MHSSDAERGFLEHCLQAAVCIPELQEDLKDWRCFCAMSGIDADPSIGITPQVWWLSRL